MHTRRITLGIFYLICLSLLPLSACSSSGTPASTTTATNYSGSASVGDLITMSIDHTAKTLTYHNLTNNQSGTSAYTVNSDGSYSFTDPNLVKAWEVPNYATFLQVKNAGSDTQTQALVTAAVQMAVTTSTFNSQNYNYIQFRTAGGGVHVGWVSIDASGNLSGNAYRPWLVLNPTVPSPFKSAVADGAVNLATAAISNGYLTVVQGSKTNYVFGTNNGLFVMDSPKGTTLALPKTTSASFNSSFAGTYNLLSYSKVVTAVDETTAVETGTPALSTGSVTLDSLGNITVKDSTGATSLQGLLQPISTATNVPSGMGDACNGLYTIRISKGTGKWDLFVGFLPGQTGTPNVIFLAAFFTPTTLNVDQSYSYLYGVGAAQ